jgi:hypothetical protein
VRCIIIPFALFCSASAGGTHRPRFRSASREGAAGVLSWKPGHVRPLGFSAVRSAFVSPTRWGRCPCAMPSTHIPAPCPAACPSAARSADKYKWQESESDHRERRKAGAAAPASVTGLTARNSGNGGKLLPLP